MANLPYWVTGYVLSARSSASALMHIKWAGLSAVNEPPREWRQNCPTQHKEVSMSDKTLHQMILDELEWDPRINPAHVGVAVDDGVVTLSGHVSSYAEKAAVEEAVKHVNGVRGIAQEVEVRLPGDKQSGDDQIARRALDIIAWDSTIPDGKVQVKVQNSIVTLNGDVDWYYQKDDAENAVRKLTGVKALVNNIKVKPSAKAFDVKDRIEAALKRSAEMEANAIKVSASDGHVTLSGKVKTYYERELAERTAWSAPGVTMVNDQIVVG
jgi:osmotically-inducible protein OsmY